MGAEDSLVVIRRGIVVVLQVFGLRGRGRGRGLVVALERGLVVALPLFGFRGRGRGRCRGGDHRAEHLRRRGGGAARCLKGKKGA